MRVIHIGTSDIGGGAARAMYRLHRGLCGLGVESRVLVREQRSADPDVLRMRLEDTSEASQASAELARVQARCIDENRTRVSNTFFSLSDPGYDLSGHPAVRQADVVHLHWVAGVLSPGGLAALQRLGKPVVWTLHDQRPLTGGCHFTCGCRGFEDGCGDCPQLRSNPFALPAAALRDARESLDPRIVHVVSPSRWLAECARRSVMFRDAAIEVIPYGLDTAVFRPVDRADARRTLGVSPDAICFLVGADHCNEHRKGFHVLAEALRRMSWWPAFCYRALREKVVFLCFGQGDGPWPRMMIPVRRLGRLNTDAGLARTFSAADVFLMPSLEDNLPLVLLEAMCCGTPSIAACVGGVPDVVTDGVNGLLVAPGSAVDMAIAMHRLATGGDELRRLQATCREQAPLLFALERQAGHYLDLYERLCAARRGRTRGPGRVPSPAHAAACDPGAESRPAEVVPLVRPGPHVAAAIALAREDWQRRTDAHPGG